MTVEIVDSVAQEIVQEVQKYSQELASNREHTLEILDSYLESCHPLSYEFLSSYLGIDFQAPGLSKIGAPTYECYRHDIDINPKSELCPEKKWGEDVKGKEIYVETYSVLHESVHALIQDTSYSVFVKNKPEITIKKLCVGDEFSLLEGKLSSRYMKWLASADPGPNIHESYATGISLHLMDVLTEKTGDSNFSLAASTIRNHYVNKYIDALKWIPTPDKVEPYNRALSLSSAYAYDSQKVDKMLWTNKEQVVSDILNATFTTITEPMLV